MLVLLIRTAKYAGVHMALAPLTLGLAWLLTENGMHYVPATICAYFAHFTCAFFINRHWTFDARNISKTGGLLRAYAVGGWSFFIVLAVVAFSVEVLRLDFFWSRLLAMLVASVWDFVLDSFFTYRPWKRV